MDNMGYVQDQFRMRSTQGTGNKLTAVTIVLAGVAALVATLLSLVSIWLQLKNYRKPLLQRYVVRILIMVPIYSASSWGSIMSIKAAFWLDPLRDIYEAFTIYTFFQLLINFIGGERSLIIMMHGRRPVHHPWPLGHLPPVDISDPHTFLAIKRGILQYAWLKPILAFATIIMKATHTYKEGYLGVDSGYLWTGILYNVSVTLSLYSLAMFWVCMHEDLKPFRPMPKFLCIKLIIFASYWQGFLLSIIQWLGAIPNDVPGYSADNLAAAIQDALICFEMPIFAMSHWYAFSWHDYADVTISAARMPVKYAARDAFGVRDLIEDTKETFGGSNYGYRAFDSGDNVLAHEQSASREARMMAGLRYDREGKRKYWIPKPGEVNSRTPLLGASSASSSRERGAARSGNRNAAHDYRATDPDLEIAIDDEDESLYTSARAMEFGDYHYPVITAHTPSRRRWMEQDPEIITPATNRNLLQPTKAHEERRRSELRDSIQKGKHGSGSRSRQRTTGVGSKLEGSRLARTESSKSENSSQSGRSQLVDLVVEDTQAEEAERVRARKEGGAKWNEEETRLFVRTYGDDEVSEGEEIREGFEPADVPSTEPPEFAVGDDEEDFEETDRKNKQPEYGSLNEERNIWDSPGRS